MSESIKNTTLPFLPRRLTVHRVLDLTPNWPEHLKALIDKKSAEEVLSVSVVDPNYAERKAALEQDEIFKGVSWPSAVPGFHSIALSEKRLTLCVIVMPRVSALEQLTGVFDTLFYDSSLTQESFRASQLSKLAATDARMYASGEFEPHRSLLQKAAFVLEEQGESGWRARMRAKRTRGLFHEPRARRDVIVIGAGLSGANAAWTLTQLGFQVRMIDQAVVPGAAASALACGILHPHFSRDDNVLSRLSREGFLQTRDRLLLLQGKGYESLYFPLGCLQMAHSDEIWQEWQSARSQAHPFVMPPEYARLLDQKAASEKVGVALRRGGWWFEGGGLVRVGAYCRALVQDARIPYRGNTSVKALRRCENGWVLIGEQGEVLDCASEVVVAAAYDSISLLNSECLPMQALKGRITLLRDTDLSNLKAPVSGEGYITRLPSEGFVGVGATYEMIARDERSAHEENLSKLDELLLQEEPVVVTGAYAGTRAVGHARLPYVGAVIDESALREKTTSEHKSWELGMLPTMPGLWLLAGMGSRGVSFSALASQILAAHMLGLPMPVDATMVKSLLPARVMQQIRKVG